MRVSGADLAKCAVYLLAGLVVFFFVAAGCLNFKSSIEETGRKVAHYGR